MTDPDLMSLWITARLAGTTTIMLILLGTPLAWWLARTASRWRLVLEPVIALPIVLPPTVLGFYLLIVFSPEHPLGGLYYQLTGATLAFSFTGLVVGSIIYSLPFYVQPLMLAFEGIDERLLQTAATLGANSLDRFMTVAVPLARRGFVTASCLAFAHTVGEFGVVLMIGGNLPDETRVLSIALYDHVETLDYARAHQLAAGLLVFSLALLALIYTLNRRWQFNQLGKQP